MKPGASGGTTAGGFVAGRRPRSVNAGMVGRDVGGRGGVTGLIPMGVGRVTSDRKRGPAMTPGRYEGDGRHCLTSEGGR